MKKKCVSLLLALVMCLSLLPVTASAAEDRPPDWNFLAVIFKSTDLTWEEDGTAVRVKNTYSAGDVRMLRDQVNGFAEFMAGTGVMTPHVTILEIDTPLTRLEDSSVGPYLTVKLAYELLKDAVDLDRYDHVTAFADLSPLKVSYWGVTPSGGCFDNGTSYSFVCAARAGSLNPGRTAGKDALRPMFVIVHEFLHTMEFRDGTFDLHAIETDYSQTSAEYNDVKYSACETDIIQNKVKGPHGTGVGPICWRYPPCVLRAARELTVSGESAVIGSGVFRKFRGLERVTILPGVTAIGHHAFQFCTGLSGVTLPAGITSIEDGTFEQCTALTEITIPSGVTGIGIWAFESCAALARISLPASVTSIGAAAFQKSGVKDVYYGGTEAQWKAIRIGGYNGPLTNANIHYNHLMADVKTTDAFAPSIAWALGEGITGGTGGGKFSPNSPCTQAQILTFLWRANGSPKPAGAVSGGEYYAAAVQWAKEQDLIDGAFSAGAPCTRAMAVTYLWKLAGSPAAKAAAFIDVPAGADCAGAVSWAVEQGVTAGTGGSAFSPDRACTRGQIVTFLYRALAG